MLALALLTAAISPIHSQAAWMNNSAARCLCETFALPSIKISATEKHRLEIIAGVGRSGSNKRAFALMSRPSPGPVRKDGLEYVLTHNGKIEDSGKVSEDAIMITTRGTGRYELYVVRTQPDGSKEQIANVASFDVRFLE